MSEPDAYGLLDEGEVHYATPFRDEAERVFRRTEDKDSVIVPLYRSPTLTDAEREAVEWAAREADQWEDDEPVPHQHAATLRGLLERMGGGR